jgi:hypothetical protein
MQQLIAGLLLVVQIQLNMFRAFLCPSSGAYQLAQQPLVYRRNVVVAVLLVVVGPGVVVAVLLIVVGPGVVVAVLLVVVGPGVVVAVLLVVVGPTGPTTTNSAATTTFLR